MPREGTKTFIAFTPCFIKGIVLRLDMPREGTKTDLRFFFLPFLVIEIRYAPGGDENANN